MTPVIYQSERLEKTKQYLVVVKPDNFPVDIYFLFQLDLNAPDLGTLKYEPRTLKLIRFRIGPQFEVKYFTQPTFFCTLSPADHSWLMEQLPIEVNKVMLEGLRLIRKTEDANNPSLQC